MGKAIFCDRCNELFNAREVDVKSGKLVDFWNEDMEVDLCPICRSSVEEHVFGMDIKKKKKKS